MLQAPPNRLLTCMDWPPRSGPLKAVARVRIPSGLLCDVSGHRRTPEPMVRGFCLAFWILWLVVPGEVEGEGAQEFAGGGVDDAGVGVGGAAAGRGGFGQGGVDRGGGGAVREGHGGAGGGGVGGGR